MAAMLGAIKGVWRAIVLIGVAVLLPGIAWLIASLADGALGQREKELIAVGISVVVNCESCMQWHIEQAAQHGATLEETIEAIDVAIEMGGGPATVAARFAMDVIVDVFDT